LHLTDTDIGFAASCYLVGAVRALAIAVFYALGTGISGIAGPWLFGSLIGTGDRSLVAWGYAFGSALVELKLGVAAGAPFTRRRCCAVVDC
jgi:hypothetical protein